MTEFAPDEERDQVLGELFLHPENKICFDCGASNPKWASVNNAVFLCFQCAGKHRHFGVHISFMRSCALDKWKRKHLEQMKVGGNKAAKVYFEKNDLVQAGQHNYASPLAAKYRASIEKKAEGMKKEKMEPEIVEQIEKLEPEPEPVEKKIFEVRKDKKLPIVEKKPIQTVVDKPILAKYFLFII